MSIDPLVQQISAGGAVAVVLTATVMRFLPAFMRAVRETRSNGSEHGWYNNKVGNLSPEDWEGRIREIQRVSHELEMADIRNLFEARDIVLGEKVRRIVREAIQEERRRKGE